MDNSIVKLLKEIEKRTKKRNEIDKEISILQTKLTNSCKHENTRTDEDYFSPPEYYHKNGDPIYFKKNYTQICNICNKILSTWVEK